MSLGDNGHRQNLHQAQLASELDQQRLAKADWPMPLADALAPAQLGEQLVNLLATVCGMDLRQQVQARGVGASVYTLVTPAAFDHQ